MVYLSGVHATLAGVVLGLLTPAGSWFGHEGFSAAAHDLLRRYDAELARDRAEQAEVVLGELEVLCRETEPPLERLERMLHPWSSFVVLPLFAFLNAGVALDAPSLRAAATSRVAVGVLAGLVAGKAIGVLGASWLAVRIGLARLPQGATWPHVAGVALLAGIGFTVSLFITDLAFTAEADLNAAKIGILAASVLAGVLGYTYLRWTTPAGAAGADDR
jgi:NhaA family Na+:H+ antiporter